ncbi:hypothetical protein ACFOET_00805, partial [Parapedobacter deserti]
MIRTLLLLFALSAIAPVQGQDVRIVPPSPESAAAFKFTEVPTSLYTGLPQIGVDIFTVEAGVIRIPIRLGYHARGIPVAEVASRTGLGWSLSFGGSITRQVRGLADEITFGYLFQNYYNGVFGNPTLRAQMYSDVVNFNLDMEPDLYMIDANGIGNKFILDQVDKKALLQRHDDMSVERLMGTSAYIEGWKVTDNRGIVYYFGRSKNGARHARSVDWTLNTYVFRLGSGLAQYPDDGVRAPNTWHLMEVETPTGHKVEFVYEEEAAELYRRSFDRIENNIPSSHFARVSSRQQQIKEIIYDGGKVVFAPQTTNRQDLSGAKALGRISIYDKQNTLIKEYEFSYQYTTSPIDNNNVLSYLRTAEPEASKRLFLNSIQEFAPGSGQLPPYTFTYNTATLLPNRFSNSVDNWGFFNGKPNGQYLTFFTYGSQSVTRQVDTIRAAAGILTKMTYPTGGSVLFAYEHNKAVAAPFITNMLYAPNNPTDTVAKLESLLKNAMYYANGKYSKQITIGGGLLGQLHFAIDRPWCDPTSEENYCRYNVRLFNASRSYTLYIPPATERTLTVIPDTYSLEVAPVHPQSHDVNDYHNTFFVTLKWNELVESAEGGESEIWFAAGKRIRQITYANPDGTAMRRTYSYLKPEGGTSGQIFGLPAFFTLGAYSPSFGYLIAGHHGARPGSPLTSLQGNSVGYEFVTEYFGDQQANHGKTEYRFTMSLDGGQYYKFPYHLPIDNEWLRGKVLSESTYEKTTDSYVLRRSKINRYAYAGTPDVEGVFYTPFMHVDSTHVYLKARTHHYLPLLQFVADPDVPGSYSHRVYYQTGGTMDLYDSKATVFENGSEEFEQTSTFGYDYNRHYQLIRTEKTTSDGSEEVSYTSYPPDYANTSGFIKEMKDNHLISYPIEQVKYKEVGTTRTILSGSITTYKPGGQGLVDQVLELETVSPVPLASFKFSNRSTAGQLPPSAGGPANYSADTRYKP